jgi:hypothetical protein
MRCLTARRWITRDLAGELTPRRVERLAQHLERCAGCRRERVAYATLDRALGGLPVAAALPPRLEQDTLRRVRLAAADDVPGARRLGRWLGLAVPPLAATAALLLAVRGAGPPAEPGHESAAPGAQARRASSPTAAPPVRVARPAAPSAAAPRHRRTEPVVPSEPPPDLAARPDLFVNLPILRNLERLEHYDAITTLDDPNGGQSSG